MHLPFTSRFQRFIARFGASSHCRLSVREVWLDWLHRQTKTAALATTKHVDHAASSRATERLPHRFFSRIRPERKNIMRIKHIALFAAVAAVSFSSGAAPQTTDNEVVKVRAPNVKQVRMAPFMYDRVQGEYALEDGRVLQVSGKLNGSQRALYADLGDGPVELVHVGSKRFVAVDRELSLRFQGDRIPETVFVREGDRRAVASTQR